MNVFLTYIPTIYHTAFGTGCQEEKTLIIMKNLRFDVFDTETEVFDMKLKERNFDRFAVVHCRGMRADTRAGYIASQNLIDPWFAAFNDAHDKLVD